MLTVRAATAADVEPLAELLAQSCVLDPVVSWLINDHALRYLTMHRFFSAEVEFGVRHGIVDVVGHCDAGGDLVSAPVRPAARCGASAAQIAGLR
ncbi:hypothetical protein O7553_19600 [Solwaraspora sp. WMMA2059]|nr:hypothetical protein [Solwaraspora sp. WMMA2059]WBB95577.1 hypothetical protein O7553_19600 [Solwaraspora sp. WMMA2059]